MLLCALVLLFSAKHAPQETLKGESGARSVTLDIEPFEGPARAGVRSQLVPVRIGGLVYVASALRVFALDAGTLATRWSAGPPSGWFALTEARRAELLEGLDHELAWVAPAVSERAVVVPLQLPVSRGMRQECAGQLISKALPERRLFAFDPATGRRLWDHVPPATPRSADARRLAPAERASVIGPPLVVEERVLVPCSSDESSIDYHVAAYELADGSPAWATFVVRGQVQRGPLGHLVNEFLAPPLVLTPDGRHVLVLTGLGTLALLDARTGEPCWSTRYPHGLIPRTHAYMPPRRTLRWRTMPPLVVGDTVLAAAPDSDALVAFDLVDGRLLWSLSDFDVSARHSCWPAFDHLAGGAGDTLYFGGPELAAVRCIGGLRAPTSWKLVWATSEGCAPGARVRLAEDTLFVPAGGTLREIDAATGAQRRVREADATLGLLVGESELFALGTSALARLDR